MIYRVEIRKDGAVASCDEVELKLKNGNAVFYVEADSKTDAIKSAKASWARFQARVAAKFGVLCKWCHKRERVTSQFCRECQDKANAYSREARAAGADLPPQERAVLMAKRAEDKRQRLVENMRSLRERAVEKTMARADARWDAPGFRPTNHDQVAALRQCLRAYDRDPVGFREWLLAKLEAAVMATAAE